MGYPPVTPKQKNAVRAHGILTPAHSVYDAMSPSYPVSPMASPPQHQMVLRNQNTGLFDTPVQELAEVTYPTPAPQTTQPFDINSFIAERVQQGIQEALRQERLKNPEHFKQSTATPTFVPQALRYEPQAEAPPMTPPQPAGAPQEFSFKNPGHFFGKITVSEDASAILGTVHDGRPSPWSNRQNMYQEATVSGQGRILTTDTTIAGMRAFQERIPFPGQQ